MTPPNVPTAAERAGEELTAAELSAIEAQFKLRDAINAMGADLDARAARIAELESALLAARRENDRLRGALGSVTAVSQPSAQQSWMEALRIAAAALAATPAAAPHSRARMREVREGLEIGGTCIRCGNWTMTRLPDGSCGCPATPEPR